METKTTPKDFFLNLAWLATLYGSVISLLNLLFDVISRVFPDVVAPYYVSTGYSASIRWSIAVMIVLFPAYILISRYLRKVFVAEPVKREIWVRRWFVFLTLFLSSATMIVDVIVLINSFLGGELTTRFLLKILATLIVAGAVFGYYFYDLRTEGGSNRAGKMFAILSALLVVASLIWAFVVIGSPANERLRRFDGQKVQDLQNIQWQVVSYWQAKGKLPVGLATLNDSISGFIAPVDPQTKQSYDYKTTGNKAFQLCANFNLDNKTDPVNSVKTAPVGFYDNWQHFSGSVCFDRTIDAEFYPVKPVPAR